MTTPAIRRARVLRLLVKYEDPATVGEIYAATRIPESTVRRVLRDLHSDGLAEPTGTSFSGATCWVATAKARTTNGAT